MHWLASLTERVTEIERAVDVDTGNRDALVGPSTRAMTTPNQRILRTGDRSIVHLRHWLTAPKWCNKPIRSEHSSAINTI